MTEQDHFLALLDLPDEAARTHYLDTACGNCPALRARLELLLHSHDTAGSFLDQPAVAPATPHATDALDPNGLNPDEGTAAAMAMLAPAGRPGSLGRLDGYEVLEVLGRGAFGIVFRAFDDALERTVALKVLDPRLALTSPARRRFLREARAAAQVRHPNVVQVHAVGEQPLPYLVMELVPGETLQQRLDRTGPFEAAEVARIGRQVAEALDAAHKMGLIHRDIKPGNILLEPGPRPLVKVTDFGLARAADDASATQSGVLAGTPMFMAPEQARGEPLDARADLFSLGSVLYTITAGRPPFRASGTLAVLKRVSEDTPRPIREIIPETPAWLVALIARLQAKAPGERFATAREVADLLARCQADPGSCGGEPSRPSAGTSPARRRRLWAAALGALTLLSGLVLAEATGLIRLRATLLRRAALDGTLVLLGGDPSLAVAIDGRDLALTGADLQEIRLPAGTHEVEVRRDGQVLRREVVTLAADRRRLVRLTEAPRLPPDAFAWEQSVAALPAAERAAAVVRRLRALNPACTDQVTTTLDQDRVIRLDMVGAGPGLHDLSPIIALPDMQGLTIRVPCPKLTDLSPLRGLALAELVVHDAGLADLSPLQDMSLSHLDVSGAARLKDLAPLRGMPLRMLSIPHTAVQDLSPLSGMKLAWLNCDATGVADLAPLEGMPLAELHLRDTRVSDLTGLRGMPLATLDYTNCPVSDISPLAGLPLQEVRCDFRPARDAAVLRSIRTLETINGKPVAEFWKEVASPARP